VRFVTNRVLEDAERSEEPRYAFAVVPSERSESRISELRDLSSAPCKAASRHEARLRTEPSRSDGWNPFSSACFSVIRFTISGHFHFPWPVLPTASQSSAVRQDKAARPRLGVTGGLLVVTFRARAVREAPQR